MPSHYDKGDYDNRDAGGGARYRGRGRGRGSYNWSSGSSGSSRYRGGSGHGASSSYRESSSYHDRYSDSRRSGSHMVNPWDDGMGPREVGGGSGYGAHASAFGASGMGSSGGSGGTSQLLGSLNQLSHMGNDKSKLALNIINAVLSSDSSMGGGRDVWDQGPPRKMRRMDWDELRPQPARRYTPRYSPRQSWDRRSGPSYSRGDDHQARRVAKARRGKPWHDTRSGKGPGREGRAKEEQDQSDDKDTSAAKATKSEETKTEEEVKTEGEGATDADNQEGKAKTEGDEDKETKEGEEGTAAEEKTDGDEEKKGPVTVKVNEDGEITWLPRESLQCHVCDLSKFPDIQSYTRHLESRRHETLKYAYNAKIAAVLHFLRANSKLAAQRKMLKNLRRGSKGPIMRCRKCQCEVFGYIREHAKTVEHIAVRNYLRVDCCNMRFFSRPELEEHRLSLVHLKNQMEAEQERKKVAETEEEEEQVIEATEEGKLFAETIKHMKEKTQFAEVTDPENLMPYDPAVPQGLNFLWKWFQYRCKACPQVRLTSAADTEEHFKSMEHYENLVAYIKAQEEEKEKKRLEEEEAARKAELERKKKEEAEAKAKEEASAEGGDNKEKSEEKEEDAGDDKEETGDTKNKGETEDKEDVVEITKETTEEQEEDTSFNFEEDMHNMETVDEACDDGEMETNMAEEDAGKEDGVGGVAADELFADITCLTEVGEELEDEKEENADLGNGENADLENGGDAVKEESEGSEIKESAKRLREEDDEPSEVVESKAPTNTKSSATPRGRRLRGRGRARGARN